MWYTIEMKSHRKIKNILIVIVAAAAVLLLVWYFIRQRFPNESYVRKYPDWTTYTSSRYGFSIQHPKRFLVNENYVNETLGPGQEIPGISFAVPPEDYNQGTNFRDAAINVEVFENSTACSPVRFLPNIKNEDVTPANIGGVQYGQARFVGAAAGQVYRELVYSRLEGTRCFGFRLFIHTSNLGMFPAEDNISEFFPGNLEKIFTDMISTFNPHINAQ